ncbi:MAG TPA: hypothetical protein VMD52_07345 [Patescibacteria group bacterium]|nr:hypothetical protein [Patescibacteria group bacterium]
MKKAFAVICMAIALCSPSKALPENTTTSDGKEKGCGVIPVSSASFKKNSAAVGMCDKSKNHIVVRDPKNKHHTILIQVSESGLTVVDVGSGDLKHHKSYHLDFKTGVIMVLGEDNHEKGGRVSPKDSEEYLAAIREMLSVVDSAYNMATDDQKSGIQQVADYLKTIESQFVTPIAAADPWRARTDTQSWNDSRAITGVEVDSANNQLILHANFDANAPQYGKGEVYIYASDIPELGQGQLDITSQKLVMEVFIPQGFITDPKSPDSLRLFVKSGDSWEAVYGIWRKVDYEDEGTWVTMEFNPTADPASWKDAHFDPTKVWELGISITKGSGTYAGDGIKIRNVRVEAGEAVSIKPPTVIDTPPAGMQDFINFSGRNLNFNEYNYGWCVGEFPAIWGQGEDGGFSNPQVKEKLRQSLLELKSQGITTVRLMALFGDLRTGILQDANGNFIYDKKGNLQFDSKVYADVKAFLDVLHETGMKAVVGLFDFRVADDISREGPRDASWAVGEHPEIFTDAKTQNAMVKLFGQFFAKVYSRNFVNYSVNDVVAFWEVMNEPESVCAADFSQVIDFHDRFFNLIRANAPGAKVTTSSLSLDSAYRFWKDKVDVISVHHYPDIESLQLDKSVGNYGFGNKPVIWTEFGDRNLTIPDVLTNIYASGAKGILFWQDSYYQFSATDYQSWVNAHLTK